MPNMSFRISGALQEIELDEGGRPEGVLGKVTWFAPKGRKVEDEGRGE